MDRQKKISLKLAKEVCSSITFEHYKQLHPTTNYQNADEYYEAIGVKRDDNQDSKNKKDTKIKQTDKKNIEKDVGDELVSLLTKTRQKSGLHQKKKVNQKSIHKIKNILESNGIDEDSDELKELAGFKDTLGQRVPDDDVGKWYVRNVAKLKKDFLAGMNEKNYKDAKAFQRAKNRINKMSKDDFGKMLAAVMSDDEEDD